MDEIGQKTFIGNDTIFKSVKNDHFWTFYKRYMKWGKIVKNGRFIDEIEIDKIRNTAEIFPFMAKFVFLWTLEMVLD